MKRNIIRQIYFYAASLITLVIMVVSGAQIVNLALKSTFFPKADDAYRTKCDAAGNVVYGYEAPRPVTEKAVTEDGEAMEEPELSEEEKAKRKAECEASIAEDRASERQRDFVQNFSMLFVAAPVFWFHFRIAQREREEEREREKKA